MAHILHKELFWFTADSFLCCLAVMGQFASW